LLARKQAFHHQRRRRCGTGSFHGGRLDLHLPEVKVDDIEEVEEHLGPAIVLGAPENIAEVEHDQIAETLDLTRYRFEP
jgi:hypothetical protein